MWFLRGVRDGGLWGSSLPIRVSNNNKSQSFLSSTVWVYSNVPLSYHLKNVYQPVPIFWLLLTPIVIALRRRRWGSRLTRSLPLQALPWSFSISRPSPYRIVLGIDIVLRQWPSWCRPSFTFPINGTGEGGEWVDRERSRRRTGLGWFDEWCRPYIRSTMSGTSRETLSVDPLPPTLTYLVSLIDYVKKS